MLIDRSHRRWIIATLLLLAGATAGHIVHARTALNPPTGGSWPGLAFGTASAAIIVFCALFGLRRKVPTLRVGSAASWLRGHIWLGLLSYPLAFYHAGFRIGGAMTIALMAVFTLVIVSGIVGLVAQHVMPRIMTERVPMETIYEQIDRILGQFVGEADRAVEAVAGPLEPEPPVPVAAPAGGDSKGKPKVEQSKGRRKKLAAPLEGSADLKAFYLETVRPFLEGAGAGPLTERGSRSATFEQVMIQLPPPLHPTLEHLEEVCEERRQLLEQKGLHVWLHGWLFVHAPLTAALLVLTAMHAVMSLAW